MSLYNGEASVVCPSVRPSVCKLLRKSLLLADKWSDRYQTFTRWTPGQRASRVCSRSRSKVTWYAHFLGFLEWATPSLMVWLKNASVTLILKTRHQIHGPVFLAEPCIVALLGVMTFGRLCGVSVVHLVFREVTESRHFFENDGFFCFRQRQCFLTNMTLITGLYHTTAVYQPWNIACERADISRPITLATASCNGQSETCVAGVAGSDV